MYCRNELILDQRIYCTLICIQKESTIIKILINFILKLKSHALKFIIMCRQ